MYGFICTHICMCLYSSICVGVWYVCINLFFRLTIFLIGVCGSHICLSVCGVIVVYKHANIQRCFCVSVNVDVHF